MGRSRPADLLTREHLIDFVETAAVGLHWVGPDGTILWANPADYEPLGYTADEYIGKNIKDFHADQEVIEDILETLTAGTPIHCYAARLLCKEGSTRDVEITSSTLFRDGPEGRRFIHTRCYTMDVTDRKRMERARDRFVSILGHDLRNPLSALSFGADKLKRAPDVPESHRRTAERLSRAALRMSRLVEDLISFARTLGDNLPLNRESIELSHLCGDLAREIEEAFPGSNVELQFEGDLRGEWDPTRISQAISNLMANAAQHGESTIWVRGRSTDTQVLLEVQNRGPTLPEEIMDEIFEPFSQTSNSQGLGLGLYIVKEVVLAHGGDVDVRSSDEEGTTFSLHLPKGGLR